MLFFATIFPKAECTDHFCRSGNFVTTPLSSNKSAIFFETNVELCFVLVEFALDQVACLVVAQRVYVVVGYQ